MKAKFSVGDPVRFTDRAAKWATEGMRRRTRKVVAVHYSERLQATLYNLGTNGGTHRSNLWLRSYELYPVNGEGRKVGRPNGKINRELRMARHNRKPSRRTDGAIASGSLILKMLNGKPNQSPQSKTGGVGNG